jgi:hypothetical protein
MRRVKVEIRQADDGGELVVVRVPPPPAAPPSLPPPPHPAARLYSPATVAVLRVLVREEKWVTAAKIAEELGLPLQSQVTPILAELGRDGCRLVEARPGNAGGHMLSIPDDQTPAEYRKRLSAWLDAISPVNEPRLPAQ